MLRKIKLSQLCLGLGTAFMLSLSTQAMEPISHFDDRSYYTGSDYADGVTHPRSRYKGKQGNYVKQNNHDTHHLASYDYPRFDKQPYYFHKGIYYYGGQYDKGIYRHGKHKFRRGHYYSRGYRYYKGKRYNPSDGRFGYYKDKYTYRNSRRYRKLREKMRRLDIKIDDAKRRYHILLDKREHFRTRHNL